jgi:quercetin dioxygenase-like cupin family protein
MSDSKSGPEVTSVTGVNVPVAPGEMAKQSLFKANGIEASVFKAKGRVSPPHAHTYTEMIYVVSGRFRDRGVEIPPGSFVVRRPGEMHEFVAEDEVTLLLVNVDQAKAA